MMAGWPQIDNYSIICVHKYAYKYLNGIIMGVLEMMQFLFNLAFLCFSDPLSHIMRVEFGLGRSKRDTYLLGWQDINHGSPMSHTRRIPDGIPAWVKLRLTNHGRIVMCDLEGLRCTLECVPGNIELLVPN